MLSPMQLGTRYPLCVDGPYFVSFAATIEAPTHKLEYFVMPNNVGEKARDRERARERST